MNDKMYVGDVRPSQLMYTYGIGSIVDLPSLSVIVMGLEDWIHHTATLTEPRLLNAVQYHLKDVEKLRALPHLDKEPNSPFDAEALQGVPVAVFPRWWVCPVCRILVPLSSGIFELDRKPYQPDRSVYRHTGCSASKGKKPPEAIPSRILVACEDGHLDDFPWIEFVHRGNPCKLDKSLLKIIEYGASGEARDLEVSCICGERRRLAEAFGKESRDKMPTCTGRRPHLRDYQPCEHKARAIVLGATNLWFPIVLGVLSIPTDTDDKLIKLVERNWNVLRPINSLDRVKLLREIEQIPRELVDYSDEAIFGAIHSYQDHQNEGDSHEPPDIKLPEWKVFSQHNSKLNNQHFRTRPLAFKTLKDKWLQELHIHDVLLVERLREVQAMIGFARLDAVGELTDPDQHVLVNPAPLSRMSPTWVPAIELLGEGIFFRFDEDAIQRWEHNQHLMEYTTPFLHSHIEWRRKRGIEGNPEEGFPGMRYILLHSFSHALMRQISLEAGYSAASLKERIYARPSGILGGPMAGVLIYTAASDSEGTLGGLIGLADRDGFLYQLVAESLKSLQLCAGDPLCAEHKPETHGRTIHGSACHACLFAPETSCERGNRYLDRSLLIPTLEIERSPMAFFKI